MLISSPEYLEASIKAAVMYLVHCKVLYYELYMNYQMHSLQQVYKIGNIILFILQVREQRLREVK